MGRQQVAAAIVVSDNFDLESLRKELLNKLGQKRIPAIFFRLDKIPRNQMGKAMRVQMSRHFEELMAKQKVEKDTQTT